MSSGCRPEQEDSLDDDAFIIPDEQVERDNLHRKLMATARSLEKQKQRLKAAQEKISRRWNKVLDTEERYGDDRHTKSYPKRKLLPEFVDTAVPPKENSTKKPGIPLHNHNRAAVDTAHDPREHPDKKTGAARSIYGSRRPTPAREFGHPNAHTSQIPVRNQPRTQQQPTTCHNASRYRGAAHPQCFTKEVLDHEFPQGFKPVNIEAYDGRTNPVVGIEDFILHIHMAHGDDLHAIKYLNSSLKGQLDTS